MALKTCVHCGRRFSAVREKCPACRRRHFGAEERLGRFGRYGLVVIGVLLVVSVSYNLTRQTGPPADLENEHSSAGAIRECRVAIDSALAADRARVEGALEPEYLGGGEYIVRGAIRVAAESGRGTGEVLCETRFSPADEWVVENVETVGEPST